MPHKELPMPTRTVCVLILLGTLGGCATNITWRQREGLDFFVAKSDKDLVATLGQPTRSWQLSDAHYVAYDYAANAWVPGEPGVRDAFTGVASGPWIDHRTCSTTFKIQKSNVVAWSLDGNACLDAPYPLVKPYASRAIANAEPSGVPALTQFPDDPFTARSSVGYGSYYGK